MRRLLSVLTAAAVPLVGLGVASAAEAEPDGVTVAFADVVATPRVGDADHRQLTIKGVVVSVDGAGVRTPLADEKVELRRESYRYGVKDVQAATVSAKDGSFTIDYTRTGTQSTGMWVSIPSDVTWAGSPVTKLDLEYRALPSRLILDPVRAPVEGHESYKVSGTAEVQQADGSWRPAEGFKARVFDECVEPAKKNVGCEEKKLSPTVTVQNNGRFSIDATYAKDDRPIAGLYEVEGGVFPYREGIHNVPVQQDITLLPPVGPAPTPTPGNPSPSPSPSPSVPPGPARVSVQAPKRAVKGGALSLVGVAGYGKAVCAGCEVDVQFQAERKHGWKTVKSAVTGKDGRYAARVKAVADGRWRARFADGKATSAGKFVDVGVRTAAKAEFSPLKPRKKAKVKVSGTLSGHDRGWRAAAGQKVCLYGYAGKKHIKLACAKTDRKGRFHLSFKAKRDLYLQVIFAGSDTYLTSVTKTSRLDVR